MKRLSDVAKEVNDKLESLSGVVDIASRMDELVGVVSTAGSKMAELSTVVPLNFFR